MPPTVFHKDLRHKDMPMSKRTKPDLRYRIAKKSQEKKILIDIMSDWYEVTAGLIEPLRKTGDKDNKFRWTTRWV